MNRVNACQNFDDDEEYEMKEMVIITLVAILLIMYLKERESEELSYDESELTDARYTNSIVRQESETRLTRKKLKWTGPMESMMLDLYVDEVNRGKKSKLGFHNTTHRFVAQELAKHFPQVKHVLDFRKVKSKLSQSFKKDYDTFLACKDAYGFVLDELTCEVKASEQDWQKFLESHPHAKKFKGVPFPDFRRLEKIFGSGAIGQASRPVNQRMIQLQSSTKSSHSLLDEKPTWNENSPKLDPPADLSRKRRRSPSSSSSYLSGHDPRDDDYEKLANAINRFAEFIKETTKSRAERRAELAITNLERAMKLYQEVHIQDASTEEALSVFNLFENEADAEIFICIKDKELRDGWLKHRIEQMNKSKTARQLTCA